MYEGSVCIYAAPTSVGQALSQARGYVVADAHARFRRTSGRSSPLRAYPEPDASQLALLNRLGIGLDDGAAASAGAPGALDELIDPLLCRAADGSEQAPLLRVSAYSGENERRLDDLGWPSTALADQRSLLGRVDGVEFEMSTNIGSKLTVFTEDPDAIGQAEFVLVSPSYPGVAELVDASQADDLDRLASRALAFQRDPALPAQGAVEALPVQGCAYLPTEQRLLPLAISPIVDLSYGEGAVLGLPERDDRHRQIAAGLHPAPPLKLRVRAPLVPRPAARFRPILLPLAEVDQSREPVSQLVFAPDAALLVLGRRSLAKALRDLDPAEDGDGEPFPRARLYGNIGGDARADLIAMIEEEGADATRFALLYAARPERGLSWRPAILRECAAFLSRFRGYAESRLRDWHSAAVPDRPEDSNPLRRRLAFWCATGLRRSIENHAALDMHLATRNARRLFERIVVFEERAGAIPSGLAESDRAAIFSSLLLNLQLLAPLAPGISTELWEGAGQASPISTAPWREPGLA